MARRKPSHWRPTIAIFTVTSALLVAGLFVPATGSARTSIPTDSTIATATALTDASGGDSPATRTTAYRGPVIAKKFLKARYGGTVRARNGVAIRVPARVMKRNGWVKIHKPAPGKYDIHIYAPWRGTVTVRMPNQSALPLLAHYASTGTVVENVTMHDGYVTARLHSLSIVQMLKCSAQILAGTIDTKGFVLCLVKNGAKTVKGGIVRDILEYLGRKIGKSLAGCEDSLPSDIPTALLDGLFDTCMAGEGNVNWQTYTQGQTSNTGSTTLGTPPGPSYIEPNFGVMNTSETLPDGVYFRNSMNWSDTSRTYGLGVFMGETVHVYCWGWGEAIGPYSNNIWYYTYNVSRPTLSSGAWNGGWINTHYVNDGMTADHPYPGIRQC